MKENGLHYPRFEFLRNKTVTKKWMKAEEAWEHRKLKSGTEEEVGVMKDPRYFELCKGCKGVSRESSHCDT